MQEIYWSQRAANLLRENMIPVPDDFVIHPKFLYGCEKQEFIASFKQLHQLAIDVYIDMAHNPADYGLPLFEIEKFRSPDREALASGHSPRSLGFMFYNMGQSGELVDGRLIVDLKRYKVLCQQKKFNGACKLLNKLSQFGFEFTGFNGKGFDKGIDSFTVAYPENPHVITALKGYSMTLGPEYHGRHVQSYFYLFFHKLLSTTDGYYIQDASDFSARLGPDKNEFFDAFNARMISLGYNVTSKFEGPFLDSWKVYYWLNNKSTGHYCYFNGGSLIFRLKLNHVGAYTDYIETCSESIRSCFENNQPCAHCRDECCFRIFYSLHGVSHEACIHCVFTFEDPMLKDLESYLRLAELERETVLEKKKR